jgi:probable rRNA maturation factor
MRKSENSTGIKFHYLEPARFPVAAVRKTLGLILKRHKKRAGSINYVFCNDEYLLEINRSYLKHDYYTDIITFDLSVPGPEITADIYISSERVKENAGELGIPIYKELVRVIIHGLLHLVGFNDKGKDEKLKIRRAEDRFLSIVLENVPRETIAKKKFHVKHRGRVS